MNKATNVIQEFALPAANSGPVGISATTAGGKLWFTEVGNNKIGSIDPTTHAIEEFALPTSNAEPVQITLGSDGRLWFAEVNNDSVGVIDPTTHATQEILLPNNHGLLGITAGPGGKL